MSAYSAAILGTSSLTGYWRLDETSGTAFAPAKSSITLNSLGTPTLGVATPIANDDGYAIAFDGSTNGLRGSGVCQTVTSNFTLEAWVNVDAYPASGYSNIFYVGTSSSGGNGYGFYVGSDGKINLLFQGRVFAFTSTNALGTGAWKHLVATRTTGAPTFYVNGATITGTTSAISPTAPATFTTVGVFYNNVSSAYTEYLDGSVDECAAYNAVLSAATIKYHYDLGVGIIANDSRSKPGRTLQAVTRAATF